MYLCHYLICECCQISLQRSIVDVQYFDTAVTCIPATLSDLVTTTRALHLQEFDYIPEHYDPGDSVTSTDLENK